MLFNITKTENLFLRKKDACYKVLQTDKKG